LIPPYFLIFLFPLGIYFLILANINRRARPFMIGGCWDAVMLSFGLSGILLWVGPTILGAFYERGLIPGSADQPNRQFNQVWTLYPWIWVSYYALVIGGQGLMIFSRRDKTIVYNVDAKALEQLVGQVLAEKGYRISAGHGLLVFDATEPGIATAQRAGAVDIEPFAPLRHAVMHWHTQDRRLRQAVDREVNERLADASTSENASASWLLSLSGAIFGLVILGAVFLILSKIFPSKW